MFPLPQGFTWSGVYSGVKSDPQKKDFSLIHCLQPTVAAGVYTQNRVVAAPVVWDRQRTPSTQIRAIAANSGNANACTGSQGERDVRRTAELTAEACGIDPEQVLILSTGIIGEHLAMDKIAAGIRAAADGLGASEQHWRDCSDGILTTDQARKVAARAVEFSGGSAALAGMAKGAGMIGPKMATMLSVLMTDAALQPEDAQNALRSAVNDSFNCIRVEGHTSTNDTVFLLSSGAALSEPLQGDDLRRLETELRELCIELAKQIPADGEGASHLMEIRVRGCKTREDAEQIARAVADGPLVKTAITGCDPNWGRIVSAAGYAGPQFDPLKMELHLNGVLLYQAGEPTPHDAKAVSQSMREQSEVAILLQFQEGDAEACCWASDLTVEYVRFNSEYHT